MRIETDTNWQTYRIHIEGLVQGVGFRPFVYRLAQDFHWQGWVENRNDGVHIKINGRPEKILEFMQRLEMEKPPAASISKIHHEKIPYESFSDFKIIKSENLSDAVTQVSPDMAVCEACLDDMENQEHRINYPFINCTHCGPRFTIIKDLPYDRPVTTMHPFVMCDTCASEYSQVLDRRFHAQPIACNSCGPRYQLEINGTLVSNLDDILSILSHGIDEGKIFAIKGLGGYHLICDAQNQEAVTRLREIKHRDAKPFAVMAASVSDLQQIANLQETEISILTAWQRPIVLLKYVGGLADSVVNGLHTIGVMLPYMPFHYQLFRALKTRFVVLTSGNISDEPIVIDDAKAKAVFSASTDGLLHYNREIYNRVDDSVCKVENNQLMVLRRSRGFAPQPLMLDFDAEGIFASGAELVNSFCLGKGNQAIMSQYLGDLKNLETLEFYEETYQRFERLFKFKPRLIVTDLHPDYLSSQFGEKLAEKYQVPLIQVQHHHAHVASTMVACNLDEPVIGISWDGIGLGTNGLGWGAEFMVADLNQFERSFYFENIPLPGGDKAAKEPWRLALAYLYQTYGSGGFEKDLPLFEAIEPQKIQTMSQLLKSGLNTPQVSSAGRLFDAVAALLGICYENRFQAEAPMRLESLVDLNEQGAYTFKIINQQISWQPMIEELVADKTSGVADSIIAARFHNSLVNSIGTICSKIRDEKQLHKVILSGGTFQNSVLLKKTSKALKIQGFEVFVPQNIPVNDQGLALGQLAIAAKRRQLGII